MRRLNLRNPSAGMLKSAKSLVVLLSLIPLARLILDGYQGNLGANPIEKVTHQTGWWALAFLLIALAITPLRQLSGWPWVGRLRRMLGLFAFFYASLHFLTYLVVDQFFSWPDIAADIAKRPYITVGFSAFVLLIPLAVTSTDGMIERLGGKTWRRLHRLVYLIGAAGVVHFWWLVKKDISEPVAFGLVLALLFAFRLTRALKERSRERMTTIHPAPAILE